VDELDFDVYSSRLTIHRSLLMEDSRQIEREIAIRAYTVQEAGKLLFGSGFVVRAVSGSIYCMGRFFGKVSPSLILLAVKKDGDGGVVLANQENAGARTP
jgi:predicted DNA-binding transcriptional regulator